LRGMNAPGAEAPGGSSTLPAGPASAAVAGGYGSPAVSGVSGASPVSSASAASTGFEDAGTSSVAGTSVPSATPAVAGSGSSRRLDLDAGRPKGLKSKMKALWELFRDAISGWVDDYAPSMGAAISYYTLFSLAPLLLIVISVAGLVFGQEAAQGQLFGQLRGLLGDDGATAVEGLLQSVELSGKGIFGTIVSLVLLAVGATTVFGELQTSLDRIWQSPAREAPSGIWGMLRSRLLSFGLILGLGFLLIVSLVVSAGLAALGNWYSPVFGGWEWLAQLMNFVVSFALITAIFAMIYKTMPSVDVAWHDVWIGAAVTSLLFAIGKFVIGLYIGKSGVASGFGAASSIVVLLVWVYYSAQIFLVGAEFTWVFANRYGSRRGSATKPGAPLSESQSAASGEARQQPSLQG
jgi:membrane protein